ncbi:head-tail connector protein [Salinarimonas soli]|uniref:PhiE125 gp8 family phage protein n=1 Tax=Salinarimonas soli TaxID=1638099 RepID=A0A5B2VFK1_9HYPH|nr:hypothetical protein [Salinarimonas soli]KAA2237240.1 hypothetical protein F0L46_09515 [Salinarimonas soli]
MTPILVAGPAVEPVTLADMRSTLRSEGGEDALIEALIRAARLLVEATSRLALLEQTWRLTLDRWPRDRIVRLPLAPLVGLEAVRVHDGAVFSTLDPGLTALDPLSDPPRLLVDATAPEPGRPMAGIEIVVRAGFGAAPEAVPAPLAQAVRLLVARWFENRGDALDDAPMPPDVAALIAPYRRLRLT